MRLEDLSNEQLMQIVNETDAELLRTGMDIKLRSLKVPFAVMRKLGLPAVIGGGNENPAVKRILEAYRSLYRKQDLAIGGHVGAYMYRDVFVRISVPIIFGNIKIDPFDYVALTESQKRFIEAEPEEIEIFLDQFADVFDVQYGSTELKPEYVRIELVERFIGLSRLQLHAAAAIVTGGYDFRGASQSALLATELALKSAAATQGLTEGEIKNRFNHNHMNLTEFVSMALPKFDAERVRRVVAKQPQYVPNRYSREQPDRRSVGHIVMGAQYIVSEVVRQLSDRDFRNNYTHSRRYPS